MESLQGIGILTATGTTNFGFQIGGQISILSIESRLNSKPDHEKRPEYFHNRKSQSIFVTEALASISRLLTYHHNTKLQLHIKTLTVTGTPNCKFPTGVQISILKLAQFQPTVNKTKLFS